MIHTRVRHDFWYRAYLIEVESLSQPESDSIEFMEKKWYRFHIFSMSVEELMGKSMGIVEDISASFDPMHSRDGFIGEDDSVIVSGYLSRKKKCPLHPYVSYPPTIELTEELEYFSMVSELICFVGVARPDRCSDISLEDIRDIYIDSLTPRSMDEAIMEYECTYFLHRSIVAHSAFYCKILLHLS